MRQVLCFLTMAAVGSQAAAQARWETTVIAEATDLEASGVSATGDRVSVAAQIGGQFFGYVWDLGAGVTAVEAPKGRAFNPAMDISGNGTVVVGFATGAAAEAHAYRNAQDLGVPDSWLESLATATNTDGTVVVGDLGGAAGQSQRSFHWQGGAFAILSPGTDSLQDTFAYAVSGDGLAIAGWIRDVATGTGLSERAVVWIAPTMEPELLPLLPGGTYSMARTASQDGQYVGGSGDSENGVVGFLFDRAAGEFQFFPPLDGNTASVVTDVNATGTRVAGYSTGGVSPTRVWFWDASHGTFSLEEYLADRGVDLTGKSFAEQDYHLSGDGHTLVGTYVAAREVLFGAQLCFADFDANGFVNGLDFGAFVDAFEAGNESGDYDRNGFINGIDYDLFVQEFEAGCGRW